MRLSKLGISALLCVLLATILAMVAAAADVLDVTTLDFEWKSGDCSVDALQTEEGYAIVLTPSGQEAYAYGFQRQRLDWSEQDGLAISVYNDSEGDVGIALQLSDEYWGSIALPEGTVVLLQETDDDSYYVAYVTNGMVSIPAQFTGRVLLPFASLAYQATQVEEELELDDAEMQALVSEVIESEMVESQVGAPVSQERMTALQGFALTFAPSGEATVTITELAFWEEGVAALLESLVAITLTIDDAALYVPMTSESMTFARVTGEQINDVVYSLVDAPEGASIDQEGRGIVDSTVTATELTIAAFVNEQLQLEETISLYNAWDVMPSDVSIDEFTVLESSYYSNLGFFVLVDFLRTYVRTSQWIVIGLWLWVSVTYFYWRRGR